MFGFSRGAYTARFLAEMLDHVGLLSVSDAIGSRSGLPAHCTRLVMRRCATLRGSELSRKQSVKFR